MDLADRTEFSGIVDDVALWTDRYAPPAPEADAEAARYPYLGLHFELQEEQVGRQPALRNIHLFSTGAFVGTGIITGGLNGMPSGVPRLTVGLSADFYRAEVDRVFTPCRDFDEPDSCEALLTRA